MKKFIATGALSAVLAACGGGGSSDPSVPAVATAPVTAPITGTAAVGAAISGGIVTAKCVSGTASTTSAANGTFSFSTSGLTTPCLLEVTYGSPAQKLHSIATAAGRTNITPLTEMVTALAFSNSALSSLYGTVTSEQLKLAGTALSGASQKALTDLSVILPLPAGFDPISGPLTPATGQSVGDVHDQLLVTLQTKLTKAVATLQELVSEMVARSTSTTPATSTVAATCAPSNFTTAAFNAIQVGMSLAQVSQTIGCLNTPLLTSRTTNYIIYGWGSMNYSGSILVWFDASGSTVTPLNNTPGVPFKYSSGF